MIEIVWEYPTRRRGFPVFLRFFPVNRGLSGNFDREGFAQDCVLRQPPTGREPSVVLPATLRQRPRIRGLFAYWFYSFMRGERKFGDTPGRWGTFSPPAVLAVRLFKVLAPGLGVVPAIPRAGPRAVPAIQC